MARAALPPLPLRDGVGPSCVAVPGAGWPTVLDFLAERLPTLTRDEWQHRLDSGQVLDAQGHPVAAELPCRGGLRLFYYRGWADEPALDGAPEQIVFQDDWLVVADKPHFMPVTPGGRFVQRSLLVRLRRRLGIDGLSPIHRIDRETAGLVAFAVQPHTRAGYQALFRDRAVHKRYEAVAPALPALALPRTHRSRLVPDPRRFFVSREEPGAPNSETHVTRAAVLGEHALYQLRPVTGQRHQLRLHLCALGAPILGDAFYPRVLRGPGEPDDPARPLQLLARELAFDDPFTGQRRQFTSALQLAAVARRWPSADAGEPAPQTSASGATSVTGASGT